MKLTVIGLGQCGSRIADQFARLNFKARAQRKATIAPTVIAVNTDQADLTGLRFIKNDYRHRVLLGLRQTLGHGVGKINELGAQLAKADCDKVLDAVKASPQFYETHAYNSQGRQGQICEQTRLCAGSLAFRARADRRVEKHVQHRYLSEVHL
jgi:cell division GTPase FtsZ